MELSCVKEIVSTSSIIWVRCTNVTDRQTDRPWNGSIDHNRWIALSAMSLKTIWTKKDTKRCYNDQMDKTFTWLPHVVHIRAQADSRQQWHDETWCDASTWDIQNDWSYKQSHNCHRTTGATDNHTTVTERLELQTITQLSQNHWSYRQSHNCHRTTGITYNHAQLSQNDWSYRWSHNCHRTTGATNNHTTVRESLHNLLVHSLPLCVSHQHSHSLTNSDCTFTVASMHFK